MSLLNEDIEAGNSYAKAYNALSYHDRSRVRSIICRALGISDTTFYDWLKKPELIKAPADKYFIACDVLGKPITDIFPKSEN